MITALRALTWAVADVMRPGTLRLVALGIALTLGLFLALQAAIFWLLRIWVPGGVSLPLLGPVEFGVILSWGSLALFPVLGFFLMAPVAAAFSGLFAENVAEAVETTHYPDRVGRSLDFLDGVIEAGAVVLAMLLVAVLTLLLLPVLGPFATILFYGANGWLLGREFFQMAARRHLGEAEARHLRLRHQGTVTGTGIILAIGLTVPLLNIVLPLLAAAAFTHLYQMLSGSDGPNSRYRPA